MAIYHINRRGEPAVCRASKGNCPLEGGEAPHFESKEAVYEAIAQEMGGAFRLKRVIEAPDFSVDEETVSTRELRLAPEAVQERKNKGEFSEFYAMHHLLTHEPPAFAPRSKKFEVAALVAGDNEYRKTVDETGAIKTFVKVGRTGEVLSVNSGKKESARMLAGIKAGAGASFPSPEAVQEACVALGFESGRIPKAVSQDKADLIAWDREGAQHRISVKSFMGSQPSLVNASTASEMRYEARLPEGMTAQEAEALLRSTEGLSTQAKVKKLKDHGIVFDSSRGYAAGETFKANLEKIDPRAERAYASAVFTVADRTHELAPHHRKAYVRTLHAFASRLTPTFLGDKDEEVTDWLFVTNTGAPRIYNFPSEESAGVFFAKRVRFNEPDKNKVPSGTLRLKGRKVILGLNAGGVLAENPRKATPVSSAKAA